MTNVFDLIEEFYTQDEEWNSVLQQACAEDFLRYKTWQGAKDGELVKIWDYITILCIYLGNSENFLGDMSRENYIDCVGWCCRNVSGFPATESNIAHFLDVMQEFYAYMKKKRIITRDNAPAEAKAKLLADGKLQIVGKDGSFLPGNDRYNLYSTPDLPTKVYLNIGERMQNLLDDVQSYYTQKQFRRDLERADFLFGGIFQNGTVQEKPGTEEYSQTFWDYFLFDYRLLEDDKTPLQHYRDVICRDVSEMDTSVDILNELIKAKLVLFDVQRRTEEGMYVCRNIFTNEKYTLMLPVDDNIDTEGYIFMGHIFYENTMVMNFLRGLVMSQTSRKRFFEVVSAAKDWFAVRQSGEMSWEEFINRNPMFVRHVSVLYAIYVRMEGFNFSTQISDYQPAALLEDKTSAMLESLRGTGLFSAYDIQLMRTMWSDFMLRGNALPDNTDADFEHWTAAVMYCFVKLNDVYTFTEKQVFAMCRATDHAKLKQMIDMLNETLQLEAHDPRYVNEEGLLLMLLQ